jgi:hypothetical protein
VIDILLSRRRLLAGASASTALGLFGGTSVTQAKAPMLNAPAPAFYRFKLGTIEATVVSDGPLSIGDPKNTFRGPTAEELGKMMSDQFLPTNNVVLDQNVLVINTGDKLALFETGMSSVKRNEDMGRLVANLKQSGIDPNDIDAVIPPTRISTMSAGSWRRMAAAISPTRRSIFPRPTWNSGPTTSVSAPRPKALRSPRARTSSRTEKLPTIGFLGPNTPSLDSRRLAAFAQRLRELGWIEGRNVAIEYRWAEGRTERLAEFATEFVRLKVDVIVTSGTPPVIAAKQATSVIPIVFAAVGDPVSTGLVTSLARPGGNVTGLSIQATDLTLSGST